MTGRIKAIKDKISSRFSKEENASSEDLFKISYTEAKKAAMKKEKSPLREDLERVPLSSIIGFAIGGVSAISDPYLIPDQIKEISEWGVENFSEFAGYLGMAAGYFGAGYLIADYLVDHLDNPIAWIPVMTNLVSAVGQSAYKKGKEIGMRERIKPQEGLESRASGYKI